MCYAYVVLTQGEIYLTANNFDIFAFTKKIISKKNTKKSKKLKNRIFYFKNVIGNRVGVTGNNRVPITSVDKLAEQNGHKAELQALRQEANRGDEIHKGY